MEPWEQRVVNAILKDGLIEAPEEVVRRLACDVEVVADPDRIRADDLWPCLWALAAILERQFSGTVYINCPRLDALRAPLPLGARCVFTAETTSAALKVGLGTNPPDGGTVWGDARGATISYGKLVESELNAHPVAGFALAGYLGFAMLATVVGVPPYRAEWATADLTMPFHPTIHRCVPAALTLIGLGQLGQAYLALLYFLIDGDQRPRLVLIDGDRFEAPNRSTQLLLDESERWCGIPKAQYLESMLRNFGWDVAGEAYDLQWNWRRSRGHPEVAILGLDSFEARRMAVASGFSWIIDAGIGASLAAPRISWHSVPPDDALARRLFGNTPRAMALLGDTPFSRRLRETPGECGWLTFQAVTASAPSLGAVAAAYAWAELLRGGSGEREAIEGRASLWSPLLPWLRTAVPSTANDPRPS